MLIQPEVSLNPPPGMSNYCFDKNIIMDIGVHLTLSVPEGIPSSVKFWKCKICQKQIEQKGMRAHVGKHIIEKEIDTDHDDLICGFCGLSCSSQLVKTSRGKNKRFLW